MKAMTLNRVVHIQARNETIHVCDVIESKVLALDEPASEQKFYEDTTTERIRRQSASDKEAMAAVTSDLRDFIAFEFALVERVEYVYTAFRENQIFYVWIVTDAFEYSVRENIYARQQAIIDEFKEFEFDFYIIARMGRDIEDLMGDDSMHLTYARS